MHGNPFIVSALIYCLLSFSATTVYSAASEINLTRSKIVQLALHLDVADPELKYEFISIALMEMYNAYSNELNKSLNNLPQNPKKRAKIRRWRFATQSYLESLDQVFYLMDSGNSLDFYVSPQDKIILLIAQHPVVVSGPNTGANKDIETKIVNQFCQRYDCREYFYEVIKSHTNSPLSAQTKNGETRFQAPRYSSITGNWLINNNMQADFITGNGIVFSFNNLENRENKQQWVIELLNELLVLLDSLYSAHNKGHAIQWSFVSIHELPVTDNSYKIMINSNGDYIKVSLPSLGANQALFKILKPWLQSYFDNRPVSRIIIENAEHFFESRNMSFKE